MFHVWKGIWHKASTQWMSAYFSVIPALSRSFYRAKAGDCLAFHMWLVRLFLLGSTPPERCLAHTRISMCCCTNAYIFLDKWMSCPVAQAYLVPGSCLVSGLVFPKPRESWSAFLTIKTTGEPQDSWNSADFQSRPFYLGDSFVQNS